MPPETRSAKRRKDAAPSSSVHQTQIPQLPEVPATVSARRRGPGGQYRKLSAAVSVPPPPNLFVPGDAITGHRLGSVEVPRYQASEISGSTVEPDTISEAYKVTLKSPSRTPAEERVWEWRRTLRRAFFNRSTSTPPRFEPKPGLSQEEVTRMNDLFLVMNSVAVHPSLIESTSIIKELRKIQRREDEFSIKAGDLCSKWTNELASR
ncbi:hypothetical protein B0H11DRAFT_1903730 [Mycena galericulata]|nr:hypothetical protein B0H11DRAFT_1903730 [Mycena galericulata]